MPPKRGSFVGPITMEGKQAPTKGDPTANKDISIPHVPSLEAKTRSESLQSDFDEEYDTDTNAVIDEDKQRKLFGDLAIGGADQRKKRRASSVNQGEIGRYSSFTLPSGPNMAANLTKHSTLFERDQYVPTFHPHGPFRRNWDLTLCVAVLYCACSVPVSASFDGHLSPEGIVVLQVLDWITDIFFVLDMIVNFNTAHVNSNGELVTSRDKISKFYLRRWFGIDFASTFPFHLLPTSFLAGADRLPRLLRLLRLFRLMKLLKLLRLSNMLSDMEAEISGEDTAYLIKLGKLIFFVTMTTHVTACMWHFVHQLNRPEEDDLDQYTDTVVILGGGPTWLMLYKPEEWHDMSLSSRYLICIYWTMTTFTSVGYGDIVPTNDTELGFVTVTEVLGALVFAAILGNASSIIASHGATEAMQRARMDEINNFIRQRCIPRELAVRVRRYFEKFYEKTTITDEDAIVKKLSQNLKQEVVYCIHEEVIEGSPFLDGAEPSFVSEVVMALRPVVVEPAEQVFCQGTIGMEMYLVQSGVVKLYSGKSLADAARVMRLDEGSYFGEDAMVTESGIRQYSVTCHQRSELLSLAKNVYLEASRNFPDIHVDLVTVVAVRVELLETAGQDDSPKKMNPLDSDHGKSSKTSTRSTSNNRRNQQDEVQEEERLVDREVSRVSRPSETSNADTNRSTSDPFNVSARFKHHHKQLSMVREMPEQHLNRSGTRKHSLTHQPSLFRSREPPSPLRRVNSGRRDTMTGSGFGDLPNSIQAEDHSSEDDFLKHSFDSKISRAAIDRDRHSIPRNAWDSADEERHKPKRISTAVPSVRPSGITDSMINRYANHRSSSSSSSIDKAVEGLERQVQLLGSKLADHEPLFDHLRRIEQMLQHVILQYTVIVPTENTNSPHQPLNSVERLRSLGGTPGHSPVIQGSPLAHVNPSERHRIRRYSDLDQPNVP